MERKLELPFSVKTVNNKPKEKNLSHKRKEIGPFVLVPVLRNP